MIKRKHLIFKGPELESLQAHPLRDIVPMSLGVSIRDAVVEPIVILDGMAIDGCVRAREAARQGLACPYRVFDAGVDGHPLNFLGTACRERFTLAQRAILAVRLLEYNERCPETLARHDRGFAGAIHTKRGRLVFLDAWSLKERTFYRAWSIADDGLRQAVFDGRMALDNASQLSKITSRQARDRILRLPYGEHAYAIREALKEENGRQEPFDFSAEHSPLG